MIIGQYVKTFAEADMGMLEGVSLNAPYKFHWLYLKAIDGDHIVCTGGGDEMRLPFKQTPHGDRATVTVQDPIFGPTQFEVHPFLQRSVCTKCGGTHKDGSCEGPPRPSRPLPHKPYA